MHIDNNILITIALVVCIIIIGILRVIEVKLKAKCNKEEKKLSDTAYLELMQSSPQTNDRTRAFAALPIKEQLRRRTQALIDEANSNGYVIRIDLVSQTPLKMGHYCMVYDIRESRHKYNSK